MLKIPQNIFHFPQFSFDKIIKNQFISPSIEKTDCSIASLKYESSYSYCHVCKRIHILAKDRSRTKNCCFCCTRNSCPKHSASVCIDCLNCFIYWKKNFYKNNLILVLKKIFWNVGYPTFFLFGREE